MRDLFNRYSRICPIFRRRLLLPLLIILIGHIQACNKNTETPAVNEKHVHSIIPLPENVEVLEGNLSLDKNVIVVNNPGFESSIALVESTLNEVFDSPVSRKDQPGNGVNIIFYFEVKLSSEEYQLDIGANGITVKAGSPAAAYYAAQSIRQMVWNVCPGGKTGSFLLRQMKIKDKPSYAWRGVHLDVARHMFTREYLFRIIDWMSYYKLNKLQLHLTDDQGWRIEIDQFPLLTEKGAWREFDSYDSTCIEYSKTNPYFTIDPRFIKEVNGKKQYGGYYSKQDIREIIKYASEHFIDIIPEIDMPGHMSAAIRSYPYLSCSDSAGWGNEFSFPICPCNQETMDFTFAVWDEVAELFPSNVLHIGCDEVETATWEASAGCLTFMQEHNMLNSREIQNYFVTQLQEHLQAKGKTVIAWDDVIEGEVDDKLVMMYWRDWVTDSPDRCATNGNSIILSPVTPFYFSGDNSDLSLETLFQFIPTGKYDLAVVNKVIGIQSCMWTEIIPSEPLFEEFMFPKLQALSEVCWSSSRDWRSFQVRMSSHFNFMNEQGIHYSRPSWMK